MAKKKRGAAHAGGHGWYVSFADLMGLMMSFFVMLVAFSTMDNNKLKIVAGSMRDAFGVQTDARYSGIIESRWPADQAEAEERRAYFARMTRPICRPRTSRIAAASAVPALKIDREFALASASLRQALQDMPELTEISEAHHV